MSRYQTEQKVVTQEDIDKALAETIEDRVTPFAQFDYAT